ncbi:MAG: leucyl/phenylalanyl-tRNA--protein transferase [Acidimicrobiia bacterium]|nr:leucyl/phenylalanyl-tRNA--protein transferase [Acidimicrobiia bacterium]
MPVEPATSRWLFPDPAQAGPDDVVAIGADLEPGTLLAAYRTGLFPMYLPDGGPLAWWSPMQRGILPVEGMRVSRSLRRSIRRFEWSVDEAFDDVVAGCADPVRSHGWITPDIADAYRELHRLGHAHSIEVWESGRLVGGLYGVNIGGLFAGESMFHRVADASKVALVRLVEIMSTTPAPLVDTQWQTDHLASLGGIEIGREDYLSRLSEALHSPIPGRLAGR